MTQRVELAGRSDQERITILGKNIEITQPIKDYVMEKISKMEKIQHHIIDIAVRVDVQKTNHLVDVVMKFSHFKINVHAATHDLYASIDKAFDRLKAKYRKWKGRIQDHHAKGVAAIDLHVQVLEKIPDEVQEFNDEIEEQKLHEMEDVLALPKVYKRKTRALKVLNLTEAVMKMELSDDHFLIYRSEEDKQLKILYRRRDNSYGVISLAPDSVHGR